MIKKINISIAFYMFFTSCFILIGYQNAAFGQRVVKAIGESKVETKKLAPQDEFNNLIQNKNKCGWGNFGYRQYLVNKDKSHRYRVTVRTYWIEGIKSRQSDKVYISEAGGEQRIGCTDSGYMPIKYYTRKVVGEVKIENKK